MKDCKGQQQRGCGERPMASQCAAFPYQIGGHHVILRHPHDNRLLVKPAFAKEVEFYTDAQGASTEDPSLWQLIPAFHGVTEVEPIGECIVLEDLTFGMANPSILDVKMGRRLYDDDASEEKVQRTMAKAALSTLLAVGFRVNGIRVWAVPHLNSPLRPSRAHLTDRTYSPFARARNKRCRL